MTDVEKIKTELTLRKIECQKLAYIAAEKNLHWTMEANDLLVREYSQLIEFIDSLLERQVSENLEKEIDAYIGYPKEPDEGLGATLRRDAFRAGAEWQKEQMMKDSIKADVGYYNQRGLSFFLDKSLESMGFDMDDKVQIIVIKKE